jgi:hypothetical protein
MVTKVTTKDLIGDLENFPIEVVEKMLIEQYRQWGKIDITIFQYNRSDAKKGFSWENTADGYDFWNDVIGKKRFDVFFERYPRRHPLHPKSKAVYIRGDEKNGENVIKELESRGGVNIWNKMGIANHMLYFIDPVTNYIERAVDPQCKNLLETVYTEISPCESENTMVELTMQEIADKLGVDVDKLRIKK